MLEYNIKVLGVFIQKTISFIHLGTIASFNWDTSSTSNLKTALILNVHLADQHYNICIRRSEGYCSLCFSPEIANAAANSGSSFGVSTGSSDPALKGAVDEICTGITTINPADDAAQVGHGTVSIKHINEKRLPSSISS